MKFSSNTTGVDAGYQSSCTFQESNHKKKSSVYDDPYFGSSSGYSHPQQSQATTNPASFGQFVSTGSVILFLGWYVFLGGESKSPNEQTASIGQTVKTEKKSAAKRKAKKEAENVGAIECEDCPDYKPGEKYPPAPGTYEKKVRGRVSEAPRLEDYKEENESENEQAPRKPKVPIATEYIEKHFRHAKFEMEKTGIPASIYLAQALVESAAGESENAYGFSNHFGHKCFRKRHDHCCVKAHDDNNDDSFVIYPDPSACYAVHSEKLSKGRYEIFHNSVPPSGRPKVVTNDKSEADAKHDAEMWQLAVNNWENPRLRWAYGLDAVGYATSKTYAKSLINMINTHRLQKYDR